MIVRSSRIRFLEAWARKLHSQNPEEVGHAVEVFAQARWKVSKRTARKYAREILQLLNLTEEERSSHHSQPLTQYLREDATA